MKPQFVARVRSYSQPVFVFVIALLLFARSTSNGFLSYDDEIYVTANPQIQSGLTPSSIGWAFTSGQGANWFPLTRLSHMLDVEIFGDDPRGHHATSVLLHALNSALVCLVLTRLTGARGASFAAGLLFAVHPLHVESVSWVSSRKDVLSGFFWLLGMAAYLAYVKRPTRYRYALVALLFVGTFMSKPVAVTFPAALLLLDFWPLARMQRGGGLLGRREALGLFVEKLPLFALALAFSAITYYVQRGGGAMQEFAGLPFGARLNNALVSYVRYAVHALWPFDLMFPYQHLGAARPWWQGGLAGLLLVGVSALCVLVRRTWPSAIVGWLWFLGTLLPVVGLVQVGYQAMADRYTYLPILGLFFMVLWPLSEMRVVVARRIAIASLVAVTVLFAALTWRQQGFWRDNIALMSRALTIEPDNVPARVQLAVVYLRANDPVAAETQLRAAIETDPESAAAWSNLGSALRMQGRSGDAVVAFRRAMELDPGQSVPVLNLASLLVELGRVDEARGLIEAAVRRLPSDEELVRRLDELRAH